MPEPLAGVNVMLLGAVGSGKTTAIRTLCDAGLEVFVLFLDTSAEVISDDPRLHWRYIPPSQMSWKNLMASAKLINTLSSEALQKSAIERSACTEWLDILNQCNDFVDQHGKHFGDVMTWNTDRVFVIDPLTGLNKASRNLTVGLKPNPTQPEWGTMMSNEFIFVDTLCLNTRCHFVLTAHIDPERDEVTGLVRNMASALGRKLAPILPVNFSDVILAQRKGTTFSWTTADLQTDTKARHVPVQDTISPSFVQIIENWKKRGGQICPTINQAPKA